MKINKTTKKLTEYIVFPLAFFICGILFLYQALGPVINIIINGWELFSFNSNTVFGEEIHNDIFGEGKLEGHSDTIPSSKITYPTVGTKYAEITITTGDTVNIIPLYFGDTKAILRKGAGQYMGSHFPGENSTIIVSAHNNSFFNCLQYVQIGDIIKIETNYGTYLYKAEKTEIKKTGPDLYSVREEYENLVLYTCYPFDELGLTPYRYFVVCSLVSGPKILIYE